MARKNAWKMDKRKIHFWVEGKYTQRHPLISSHPIPIWHSSDWGWPKCDAARQHKHKNIIPSPPFWAHKNGLKIHQFSRCQPASLPNSFISSYFSYKKKYVFVDEILAIFTSFISGKKSLAKRLA